MLPVQSLYQTSRAKSYFSSINMTLSMLYLFIAVNDIILIPLDVVWLKSVILIILFFNSLVNPIFERNEYLTYIFIVGFLLLTSSAVLTIYGNNVEYALAENLGLIVTIVVPLIVLNLINSNPVKINKIANVFLWAIIFATLHKIGYVVYMQGYLSIDFFDFAYKDLLGRGEVDGLDRLNTGNQLLVSFAFFMAYRFFVLNCKRRFMTFVMFVCIINIYLAASRFFTPATFAVLSIFIIGGVKGKWVQKITFFTILILVTYFLSYDLFSVREASDGVDMGAYRISQSKMLFEYFLNAPFFGNGPGFAIDDLDLDKPWYFENQFLVVFAKYGLIGFISLATLVALQFKMAKFALSLYNYLILIGFIFFASIFNPYLFGTYAAWSFSIALILAYLLKESNREIIISSFMVESK